MQLKLPLLAAAIVSLVAGPNDTTLAQQTAPADKQLPNPVPTVGQPAPSLNRWFELQNTTLNLRYRFIDNSAGTITTNQLQHRETIRGRVKFHKAERRSFPDWQSLVCDGHLPHVARDSRVSLSHARDWQRRRSAAAHAV
jgi:hypothetical protein